MGEKERDSGNHDNRQTEGSEETDRQVEEMNVPQQLLRKLVS